MKEFLKRIITGLRDSEEPSEKSVSEVEREPAEGQEPEEGAKHEAGESKAVEAKEQDENQEMTKEEPEEEDSLMAHMKATLNRVGTSTKSRTMYGSNPKNNMPSLNHKSGKGK